VTCIIATPKLIAADSREHVGGTFYSTPKLFRHAGVAYGMAGDSWMGGQFEEWVKSGFSQDKRPDWSGIKDDEDFHCLELSATGIRRWDKHLAVWPVSEKKWVGIGSGADLAIGALEAGATIEQAFRIVYKRSGECGPPTVIVHLDDLKKGRP